MGGLDIVAPSVQQKKQQQRKGARHKQRGKKACYPSIDRKHDHLDIHHPLNCSIIRRHLNTMVSQSALVVRTAQEAAVVGTGISESSVCICRRLSRLGQ